MAGSIATSSIGGAEFELLSFLICRSNSAIRRRVLSGTRNFRLGFSPFSGGSSANLAPRRGSP
jgi:hypothetical protein